LDRLLKVFLDSRSVLILPHVYADGDALASSLGLAAAVEKLGAKAEILMEEPIQDNLSFLPNKHFVKVYNPESSERLDFDVVVSIDLGDLEMLGERRFVYCDAKMRVNIDHHMTNDICSDVSYVDTEAAATGEIIYELLKKMDIPFDDEIAVCLYTAILTDTGCFKYSNVTHRTHSIVASLMKYNINVSEISRKIFDVISYAKLFLTKKVLDNMILLCGGRLAVSWILNHDISKIDAKPDDLEGLVNIGRNIKNTDVSIVLKEMDPGVFKASIRSNEFVDVTKVARIFSGGGHKRAAGFTIKGNLDEVLTKVIPEIETQIQKMNL